jgi:hypothetical protein
MFHHPLRKPKARKIRDSVARRHPLGRARGRKKLLHDSKIKGQWQDGRKNRSGPKTKAGRDFPLPYGDRRDPRPCLLGPRQPPDMAPGRPVQPEAIFRNMENIAAKSQFISAFWVSLYPQGQCVVFCPWLTYHGLGPGAKPGRPTPMAFPPQAFPEADSRAAGPLPAPRPNYPRLSGPRGRKSPRTPP